MSRRIVKTLGILLAVCFLMSVTAAAVSTDPGDNSRASQKYAKGMQGKELMKGKPIVIRNLIIAKNVVVTGRTTHPLLRAAALKGMMMHKGMMGKGMTENQNMMENQGSMGNQNMMENQGTGSTEQPCTAASTSATANAGTQEGC
jgi:hypothetical protein